MVTDVRDEPYRARVGERARQDLGWARVVDKLATLCATEVGRRLARDTPIWADLEHIRLELARVQEMRLLLAAGAVPPLGGVGSVAEAIDRAGRGAALGGELLLEIADSLRNGSLLRGWFATRATEATRLAAVASNLPDLTPLARMLYATFEPTGRIRDDASPRLEDLRAKLQSAVSRAKRSLDGMLGSTALELTLQDDYYTVRDGRYVLPVKSSEKNSFGGILHGHSNTGQTAYIEPTELIGINNDIISARDDIEREEYAILRDRTDRVLDQLDTIGLMLDVVAQIDHITARARLADEMGAHCPTLNLKGRIKLDKSRNPGLLLRGIKVVSNDIQVGEPWRILVVTGPNTGGKTVTLLTTGLCVLMAQAGLHIPAGQSSEVAIFPRIFTLFGDPQSLEHDLSTFSGHLKAVHEVLREAGPGELVLMDEIIVGTEPAGGAALAIAVLEELATRQAVGVVTTHYDRLKILSLTDDRFQNASVGFDSRTQEPNYQLTIGVPGSSSPIEIARRLGLPARLVDRAVEVLGQREQDLQFALEKVEALRVQVAEEVEALRAEKRLMGDKARQLDAERGRIKLMGDKIAREQQEAALRDMQKARDEVREIVRKLQASGDPREVERGRREVERLRTVVQNRVAATSAPAAPAEVAAPVAAAPLRPVALSELREGTQVYVRSLKQTATVRTTPDSPRKVDIQVGPLKMTVDLDDLAQPNRETLRTGRAQAAKRQEDALAEAPSKAPPPSPNAPTPEGPRLPPRSAEFTVDLRGQRVDEALDELAARLDSAALEGKMGLYVIHGHGTGALKRAVREELQRSRSVESFRAGERDEGGDGVTVVFIAD